MPCCPARQPHSSGGSWCKPRPCPAIWPDLATLSPCGSSLLSSPVPPIPISASCSHQQLRASSQPVHAWRVSPRRLVVRGEAGVIIIFVFFALPWKYIVFSANPVQLHHNKTHNKNVIHFSRALRLPVSWQAIKNLSSFFWQEPCTFSSLIYESRIATDKPLLRSEGLHYL